jgi:hypothetical protein
MGKDSGGIVSCSRCDFVYNIYHVINGTCSIAIFG